MRNIFLTLLLFSALGVNAQGLAKADSAFYILDTAKTPASDRLWHTYSEGAVKFYELNVFSSCSPLLDKPTFAYSSKRGKAEPISTAMLKSVKKSSLSELIYHIKRYIEEESQTKPELKRPFYLYLIEPSLKGYTIVKTQLDGSGPRKISD